MSFVDLVKSDYKACGSISRTFLLVFCYRLARHLFLNKKRLQYKIAFIIYRLFYRMVINMLFAFDVDYRANIGAGLQVFHGQCLVIGRGVVIGKNARIRHATTIGNKGSGDFSLSPLVGDNVNIGSNCVIIGNIHIGNHAVIGAGSVVVHDVMANTVVAGNPAKLIHNNSNSITGEL